MFEVKKEILDSHEALLEVTFEPEAVEDAKREAAREISREINIPGFRKGRAPYGKVVQYVGEPAILQEAVEHLIEAHYVEFLEKADVASYGPGDFVDMEPSPLTLKIRVPLEPTVELGDYRSLREDWTAPTVSDEELEQILAQVREEHAVLEPIEGPAELGNELRVTVIATVEEDEVVHEHDIPVVLSEERPFLSVEFVNALLGATTGEERAFTLALPDTIEEPSLRGAEADFKVEVEQVYARTLPEMDDALASTVGSFETLDDLVQDIRGRVVTQKRQQLEAGYHEKLVDKLVAQADISYPPQIVDETLDDMVKTISERLQREQKMSFEDALRLQGQTLEQFRENMRPQAEDRARQILALRALAAAENIDVSTEDVMREYQKLVTQYGLAGQLANTSLDMENPLARSLRANVFEQKVYARLSAIGRGEFDQDEGASVVMPVIADEAEDDAAVVDQASDPESSMGEPEVEGAVEEVVDDTAEMDEASV